MTKPTLEEVEKFLGYSLKKVGVKQYQGHVLIADKRAAIQRGIT